MRPVCLVHLYVLKIVGTQKVFAKLMKNWPASKGRGGGGQDLNPSLFDANSHVVSTLPRDSELWSRSLSRVSEKGVGVSHDLLM